MNKLAARNRLYATDAYILHTTFSLQCHFRQCPRDLHVGSAPAERVGQRDVGGRTQRVRTAWLPLGLAIESPWSALGGPTHSSFAKMGLENGLAM